MNHFFKKTITFFPVFLALSLTAFVLRSAWQPGLFQTHDGQFHLVRLIRLIEALEQGANLPIRMIPDLAYGYGYPVFQFFYVFPYYLPALGVLGLGLSPALSLKLSLFLATFGMIWLFYDFVRRWLEAEAATYPDLQHKKTAGVQLAALTAMVIFGLVPIRFSMLFVTGQIGGYWGWFWGVCLLWAFQIFWVERKELLGGVVFSLALAGLTTSHLLTIILFGAVFGLFGLWQLARDFSWLQLSKLIGWSGLGAGLAAFYWLPFLLEKKLVQLGQEILINHRDHWPTLRQLIYSPWGHGFSTSGTGDGMSFQIGLAVVVGAGLAGAIWLVRDRWRHSAALILLAALGGLILLMLPISAPVWEILTPLQLVQYPWRLLTPTTLVGSWLVAWLVWRTPGFWKWLVSCGLIGLAVFNVRNYAQPWPLDWQSAAEMKTLPVYRGSTDISWELRPAAVDQLPDQFVGQLELTKGEVSQFEILNQNDVYFSATIQTEAGSNLTLPIWDWPHWQIQLNEQPVLAVTDASHRVQFLNLPPGEQRISVSVQKTRIQKISDLLSVLSFGLWFLFVMKLGLRSTLND